MGFGVIPPWEQMGRWWVSQNAFQPSQLLPPPAVVVVLHTLSRWQKHRTSWDVWGVALCKVSFGFSLPATANLFMYKDVLSWVLGGILERACKCYCSWEAVSALLEIPVCRELRNNQIFYSRFRQTKLKLQELSQEHFSILPPPWNQFDHNYWFATCFFF